jgi:hypothetical protein
MKERMFWIDIHYACFGVVSKDDTIILYPPIVGWMKGKTLQEIKPYLLKHKAVVKEIKLK